MRIKSRFNYSLSDIMTFVGAGAILLLLLFMISYPAEIFSASTDGLLLWFNIVLPSILPFLITAELMMGLGVIHFLGKLLEPLMRPLFNIPGPGAFVAVMGFTSGFPVGAILTSRLRSQGICTRIEAERLLCFTNNASPLFMLVAIPVGMFGLPSLGIALAAVHYGTNLLIGLAMRFYYYRDSKKIETTSGSKDNYNPSAWECMLKARRQDGRTIGRLLGDAVRLATNNLLAIGGFIVFFSVIMKVLSITGIMDAIINGIILLLPKSDPNLIKSLTIGFWEITLGSKATASQVLLPLETRIALVGIILGWSGLAIHAQVASMIADTDIRLGPFWVARLAQAVLSGIALFVAVRSGILNIAEPVWSTLIIPQLSFGTIIFYSSRLLCIGLILLLIIGVLSSVISQIWRSV